MSMPRLALIIFVACTWAPGHALAQSSTGDGAREAFDKFVSAFNALDWETFRRCFSDTASLFNPDIPDAVSLHRLDGRHDIERNFRAVFDSANAGGGSPHGPNIHPEHVRLQQFADTAVITFEFKRSKHSVGRRTIVLNKQKDSWLIVHIHASNISLRHPDTD